nr:RNA-guided endonuclease TnpB family protein [Lentilactobacillus kisonensis]
MKLPKLGWVRFKEYGYLPTDTKYYVIKSGRIKEQAGRYYLTCLVEQPEQLHERLLGDPIGVDLGVKEFAIIDDGTIYRNRNKDRQVKRIRKRLRRTQRKLSRQYIAYKARKTKEGRSATDLNLAKTERKVQRLYQRLHNIQADYQNKIVANLVRTKPNWVSIEDLNVKGMIKNCHLAKAVNQQGFYRFRTKLINKCQQLGIPVHLVNRFEPTSKICHQCEDKKSRFIFG